MPSFNPKQQYNIVPKEFRIKDFYEFSEQYVVRPPYQRKSVWSKPEKEALVAWSEYEADHVLPQC